MKPKTLQLHFLETALKEANIKYSSCSIDHMVGTCIVDGVPKGMIFPESMLDLCVASWDTRSMDYFFKGLLSNNRLWCKSYGNDGIIKNSNRGRDKSIKFTYDVDYYKSLGKTKFALCPVGDCPWSYRLFEAMMCGAIPVLGDDDHDVWIEHFKVYRHSDEKEYRQDWVDYNLSKVKELCIL